MMALAGASLFAAFVGQDIRLRPANMALADLPWGLILRYVAAMAAGGAVAGLIFAGFFGRRGVFGWVLAALGGLLATAISGALGSAFGLLPDLLADGYHSSDVIPVAAGLLVLPLAAGEQPLLLVVVAALVALTHVLCKRGRAGRAVD
jgi:hypothetical protein